MDHPESDALRAARYHLARAKTEGMMIYWTAIVEGLIKGGHS